MVLKISLSGGVHLYNTTCNSAYNYFSSPLKDFVMYIAGKKVGRRCTVPTVRTASPGPAYWGWRLWTPAGWQIDRVLTYEQSYLSLFHENCHVLVNINLYLLHFLEFHHTLPAWGLHCCQVLARLLGQSSPKTRPLEKSFPANFNRGPSFPRIGNRWTVLKDVTDSQKIE